MRWFAQRREIPVEEFREVPPLSESQEYKRKLHAVLRSITIVFALISAISLIWSANLLTLAKEDVAVRREALSHDRVEWARVNQSVQRSHAAAALMAQARGRNLALSQWGSRAVDVSQAKMSRESLNSLLEQIRRDKRRFFGAEQFDISVTSIDESLFVAPAQPGRPVLVSLRGMLYFRMGESE